MYSTRSTEAPAQHGGLDWLLEQRIGRAPVRKDSRAPGTKVSAATLAWTQINQIFQSVDNESSAERSQAKPIKELNGQTLDVMPADSAQK